MDSPQNLKSHFEIYEEELLKLIWELNFENNNQICIEYFFYYKTNIYKILYNKKVIVEEKYDKKYNLYSFVKNGHHYGILHDYKDYLHGFIIDGVFVYRTPKGFFRNLMHSRKFGAPIGDKAPIEHKAPKEDIISLKIGINAPKKIYMDF